MLVEFRRPPRPLFHDPSTPAPHPNHFEFRLKPDEGMALSVQIKGAGDSLVSAPVSLDYHYDEHRESREETAYERLIEDAMEGDQTLFARADSIEEAWRVVDPIIERPPPVRVYEPGTWGPPEAEGLATGGWHDPA
jgi:glucose-6-phosphate 1-dehydrogenase